ncbi:MAG: hypothetical protein HY924_07135 [Elusimicrobia bacterium]|nr:hypothetical protein [Elusimicrobiota bacterium]
MLREARVPGSRTRWLLLAAAAAAAPGALIWLSGGRFFIPLEPAVFLPLHNAAELFTVLVSFAVFSVGWSTHEESKDRHALFLSAGFLVVGLVDFMHTFSYAGMPAFITPNIPEKSTELWFAARLATAGVLLGSAFVRPDSRSPWLRKRPLLAASLALGVFVFAWATRSPAVEVPSKDALEALELLLWLSAAVVYWRRLSHKGRRTDLYYLAAVLLSLIGELSLGAYHSGFDTYALLKHVYKVAAFALIYKGVFAASVSAPYERLLEAETALKKDIAHRKRVEAELSRSNAELSRFAHVASHDLREPLRMVASYTQLLGRRYKGKLDADADEFIRFAVDGTVRMQSLLDDLLAYSRVRLADRKPEEVDLGRELPEVLARLRLAVEDAGASVTHDPLPVILADAGQVRQLLQNLAANALKFRSKERPCRIHVGVSRRDGECVVSVSDDGIGIDPEHFDAVFGLFQRLHPKGAYPGSGLGLAICKQIVSNWGGRIWVESKPGHGSVFSFTVPEAAPGHGAGQVPTPAKT